MSHQAQLDIRVSELMLLNWLANGSKTAVLPWLRQQQQERFYVDSGLSDESFENNAVVGAQPKLFLTEDEPYDEDNDDQQTNTNEQDKEHLYRSNRSLMPEYHSLCETVTRKVELKDDPNYEYQPPHYHEVYCKSYSLMDDEPLKAIVPSKQKCAHPSFHCVQRSRTLFIVRRRWDGDCWEPTTKVVASGCDCMWPVSTLGDVSIHY
ncbi:uncharacterized protein LOC106645321 [Copidosoma floridanum]|uniref:uncharacterized protein LOC106645321 n=1 Tax=Copidosoma floridanum TaxID=29053 RepID=UPI0006C9720E|nr:uncharacterized protein LOC106645321 [Copidosoma floridanum]